MKHAYITSLGKFLPGTPVINEEMEAYVGKIFGHESEVRARVLAQNGIKSRYYAIDRDRQSRFTASEMAANAARDALTKAGYNIESVDLIAAASTQGDCIVPGFGSMVHGDLRGPPVEIATLHGVCASSMMALRRAALQINAGESMRALVCAGEFASRLFKASRYETQAECRSEKTLPMDTEFLRWMLSDGASAAVVESAPKENGLSLKIEWIDLCSHAGDLPACMYLGLTDNRSAQAGNSWIDYADFQIAAEAGVINLRQDMKLLRKIVPLGVAHFFRLVEAGRINPKEIDWMVCHYSSEIFRGQIEELLLKGGVTIPENRWFSNLSSVGNVGSASLLLMLNGLVESGKLEPGQTILVMIPESARFITSFMRLTVVGESKALSRKTHTQTPFKIQTSPPPLETAGVAAAEELVRKLAQVWADFELNLQKVPIIQRLESGTFTIEDYQKLLYNLRQQVIDGSRWISRVASNITSEHFPLRSAFINHSRDEHRDYEMIEKDYVAIGGSLEKIKAGEKNIGSEALSSYILHRASYENPFDLLGTMFIIEGLGFRMAAQWGERIKEILELSDNQVHFLVYHSKSDVVHFKRLDLVVQSGILTPERIAAMAKAAKITARLYCLQLEELDHV